MINTSKVSCNNCKSNNFSLIGSGVDFEYQTSNQIFSFVKCKDCNLVYLNPRPRESAFNLPNFREDYLDPGKTRLRTSYIGYIFGLVFKH